MKFVSNFSLPLPPSEVPVNSNGTYLLMTILFSPKYVLSSTSVSSSSSTTTSSLAAFTGNTVLTTTLSLQAFESIPVSAVCSNKGLLFPPGGTQDAMIRQIRINLKMFACLRIRFTRKLFMPTKKTVLFC